MLTASSETAAFPWVQERERVWGAAGGAALSRPGSAPCGLSQRLGQAADPGAGGGAAGSPWSGAPILTEPRSTQSRNHEPGGQNLSKLDENPMTLIPTSPGNLEGSAHLTFRGCLYHSVSSLRSQGCWAEWTRVDESGEAPVRTCVDVCTHVPA